MDISNTAVVIRGLPAEGSIDLDELKFILASESEVRKFCCLDKNIVIAILTDSSHASTVVRKMNGSLYQREYPLQFTKLLPHEVHMVEEMLGVDRDTKPKNKSGDSAVQDLLQTINSLEDSARAQIIDSLVNMRTPASKKRRNIALENSSFSNLKPGHSTPRELKKETATQRGGGSVGNVLNENVTMLVDTEAISTPKLSIFSGVLTASGEPKPGETSYNQFRYQVRCLIRDGKFSDSAIMQAVRRATKGAAADILLTMGETVVPRQMLTKFEVIYGNVLTNEQALEAIYSARQRENEMVAAWAGRLERLTAEAVDKGALTQIAAREVSRSKFWTGLRADGLKQQTRHKFDDLDCPFDSLVTACRRVEAEQLMSRSGPEADRTQGNPGTAKHPVVQQATRDSTDEKLSQIIKMVKGLEPRPGTAATPGNVGTCAQNIFHTQPSNSEQWNRGAGTVHAGGYYAGGNYSPCETAFAQQAGYSGGTQNSPFGYGCVTADSVYYCPPDTAFVQQAGYPGGSQYMSGGQGPYQGSAPHQWTNGPQGTPGGLTRRGTTNSGSRGGPPGAGSRACFRCGREGHFKRDCPFPFPLNR